jgi:hypothetical protein
MRRAAVILGLMACEGGEATTDEGTTPTGEPGPGAFAEDFDTSADFFTLMAGPVDDGSVHGEMQIWYSTNLQPLIEAGTPFEAPEGSVAIKRQGTATLVYNVMIKGAEGDDPDVDDWTFEQRDAGFAVTNSGPIAFCYGCHAGYPDADLLAGTEVR